MSYRLRTGRAIVTATLIALSSPAGAQDPPELVGDWLGTLDAGGARLRIVFHVTRGESGALAATMDSPDQGAAGIPVSEVVLDGDSVRMSVSSIGGSYVGRLSADGERIDGSWSQGPASLPLSVERTEEAPAPERPQEPKGPLPYDAFDVTFANEPAGIRFAGTLTVPAGTGPFPAVALVSGSGPQDRDESVFGHRPFLVLADHLTRRGIAVLRYDDRGVGESGGEFGSADSRDFAADAGAAVAYLRSRPDVDAGQVGIVGHSEGGLIAPMVAADDPDVAFVVLLAAPGIDGRSILLLQSERILRAGGVPEALVTENREAQEQLFAVLAAEPDEDVARARMKDIFDELFASLSESELAMLGVTGDRDRYADAQIAQLVTPWFRYFLTYDPVSALRRVRVPVLAITGERDLQVPPDENLPPIERTLHEAGNPDATVRELPGLNHLFQTARTGSPSEYATIEETFAPAALDLIAEWVLARSRP